MSTRNAYLLRRYGITEDEYEAILNAQGRCCAVCGRPESSMTSSFHVDHDHKTGIVRGLLCFKDNKLTVGHETDPEALYAAARYLESPPAIAVLGERRVPEKPKKKRRAKK